MLSIIIPAHNESSVIERCLHSLHLSDAQQELEVIVVCNGCTDNTAELARKFDGVKVVDLARASKIAALNAGDEIANYFPRAYIDADITTGLHDLLTVAQVLRKSEVMQVAAPRMEVNLDGASFAVKAFYAVWMKLPYFSKQQMVGSGIFMLSKKGRGKFREFPEVISDDGYVRSLFSANERVTVGGASFTVYAPRRLNDLIKIKTRVRLGNKEIRCKYPQMKIGEDNTAKNLFTLIMRRPWLIPSACVYVGVQFAIKQRSDLRFRQENFATWDRDESSRKI